MMYDTVEDLKFYLQEKLKSLYDEYFANEQEVDENDSRHYYLSGMIDAYEDVLGEL